jgi:hypothetical protein
VRYRLARGGWLEVAEDDVEQRTRHPAKSDSASPRGGHERLQGLLRRATSDTDEDADRHIDFASGLVFGGPVTVHVGQLFRYLVGVNDAPRRQRIGVVEPPLRAFRQFGVGQQHGYGKQVRVS